MYQFVPHRELIVLPLERRISECCIGEQWLLVIRTIKNKCTMSIRCRDYVLSSWWYM